MRSLIEKFEGKELSEKYEDELKYIKIDMNGISKNIDEIKGYLGDVNDLFYDKRDYDALESLGDAFDFLGSLLKVISKKYPDLKNMSGTLKKFASDIEKVDKKYSKYMH